jgi:hypothetical protein
MFRKLGYLLQKRAKLLCCTSNFLLCPYFDCVNKWKTFQNYNNFIYWEWFLADMFLHLVMEAFGYFH